MSIDNLQRAKNALWSSATRAYPRDPETGKTTYVVDEYNAPVLRELAHYLVGAPCQWLDPRCGITMAGGRGTSKTELINALSATTAAGGGEPFHFVTALELVNLFNRVSRDEHQSGGSRIILHYGNLPKDLIIDDMGEEPEGKHYGDKRDVISEVLSARYNLWKRSGIRTHITTNIVTDEAMLAKYGDRIMDRLLEMNRVLPVEGPSRRGTSQPKVNERPALFEPPPPMPSEEEIEANRLRALEAIQRIKESLAPAKAQISDMRTFSSSLKAEQAAFAEGLKAMTNLELEALHARYMADDLPSAVKPYLDLIDDEFDQRREAQEQPQETTEKAA